MQSEIRVFACRPKGAQDDPEKRLIFWVSFKRIDTGYGVRLSQEIIIRPASIPSNVSFSDNGLTYVDTNNHPYHLDIVSMSRIIYAAKQVLPKP